MKLSLVMPTHRADALAMSRCLHLASLAGDALEVVISDNSGDAAKRERLAALAGPAVRVVANAPCTAAENFAAGFAASSGKFVHFVADDDFILPTGVRRLVKALHSPAAADPDVVAFAGEYLLESEAGVRHVAVDTLGHPDPVARMRAFLGASMGVLFYSAIRREFLRLQFALLGSLPIAASHHDQLMCALLVASGRVVPVPGTVYVYDETQWKEYDDALESDRRVYRAAGLPAAIDRLHWLLAAVEGATLLASPAVAPAIGEGGDALARLWWDEMLRRVQADARESGSAPGPAGDDARALRERWLREARFDPAATLDDVVGWLERHAPQAARAYGGFWSALQPRRNDAQPRTGAADPAIAGAGAAALSAASVKA